VRGEADRDDACTTAYLGEFDGNVRRTDLDNN
jgi:hypothetical protein